MYYSRQIYKITNPKTNNLVTTVTINLVNNDGISVISPFSAFLQEFRGKKSSYVVALADVITRFLNFVYFDAEYQLDSFTDFNIQMGADFINSCDLCLNSKNRYAKFLTKFYYFLFTKNMLPSFAEDDFVLYKYNDSNETIQNIFAGRYNVSDKKKKPVLHEIAPQYFHAFMRCALDVAPRIALGIYFQFQCGLRMSEVVSLTYSDVHHIIAGNTTTLKLTLSDKDLRPDLSTAFISKVKKPRQQVMIPPVDIDLFDTLYANAKSFKTDDSDALFVNSQGKPMTAQSYQSYFQRVKAEFIRRLAESDNVENVAYAITLSSHRWSTHIGRGSFTNYVAENASINELATLRGDSSMDSSMAYMTDTIKTMNNLEKYMRESLFGKEKKDEE